MMNNQQQALATIVEIVKKYKLTENDVLAALKNSVSPQANSHESVLSVSLSYIGALFILGGICAFAGIHWNELNSTARILLTLGSGITLFILSILVLSMTRAMRTAQGLLILGWLLEVSGFFVMLAELYPPIGNWKLAALTIGSITFLQFFIISIVFKHTSALALSILSMVLALYAGLAYTALDDNVQMIIMSAVLFIFSQTCVNTKHDAITPFTYFFSVGMFLLAIFDLLEKTSMDLLFLIAGILILIYGVAYKSRTVLFVSAVCLYAFIGYYTFQHFAHSTGWPIALIICGASFLVLSALVVYLKKRFM